MHPVFHYEDLVSVYFRYPYSGSKGEIVVGYYAVPYFGIGGRYEGSAICLPDRTGIGGNAYWHLFDHLRLGRSGVGYWQKSRFVQKGQFFLVEREFLVVGLLVHVLDG